MEKLTEKTMTLLREIESHGKDPAGGVTRLLYTDVWKEAQELVKTRMEEMGFTTKYDHVGNLFGRIEGSKYKDETIASGSHIDSVGNGGIYDGQYGIVAAMLAIEYLVRTYGQPLRSLEVISFAEEEGSRFPYTFWGSKNVFGQANKEDVMNITDSNGVPFLEAMHQVGCDFNEANEVRKDIRAFLEIHIEQGAVLEIEKKSVGVVHHIVGQRRFNIEVKGQANHAGTTPMKYRTDAMYATSLITQAVIDKANEYGEPLVATVGRVDVTPNIVNVVPGYVNFSLDTRHIDSAVLVEFTKEIEKIIQDVREKTGAEITLDMWMDAPPIAMDEKIVQMLEEEAEKNGFAYKMMHSGAGHDSQIIAELVPTAMIFVPSKDGISHNPNEYTSPEELTKGIELLIRGLYRLAYEE